MTRPIISQPTCDEFEDVFAGITLAQIRKFFGAAHLHPDEDFDPGPTGERRSLVRRYYATIDFCDPADIKRLLLVFEEVILYLERQAEQWPEALKQKNGLLQRMQRDGFRYEDGNFLSDRLRQALINAPSLIALNDDSIMEHIEKAGAKIEAGDFSGAITSSYTLVEGFLKELLHRLTIAFNEDEGDIRELYKLAADPLNLNPKGEHLENYLKAILQGLKQQVGGLYELSNKASDRHARRYNPARHHAKLATNAAFTLCEFLLDSFEYQEQRKGRKTVS